MIPAFQKYASTALYSVTIFILFLFSMPAFSNQSKIGLIDPNVLLHESLYGKDFMRQMDSQFRPRQEQIQARSDQLRTEKEGFKRDRELLPISERSIREAELVAVEQEIARLANDMRSDAATQEEKFNQSLRKILTDILKELATEEKLDLILPYGLVIYTTGNLDYTDKVLKIMDNRYPGMLK